MAKLEVTVVRAQGLKGLKHFTGESPFCRCEIHGKPKSQNARFQTDAAANTFEPVWNETHPVQPYTPGEDLDFSLFDRGVKRSGKYEAKVTVPSDLFYPHGFEGELPLSQGGNDTGATLQVHIQAAEASGVATPPTPATLPSPQPTQQQQLPGHYSQRQQSPLSDLSDAAPSPIPQQPSPSREPRLLEDRSGASMARGDGQGGVGGRAADHDHDGEQRQQQQHQQQRRRDDMQASGGVMGSPCRGARLSDVTVEEGHGHGHSQGQGHAAVIGTRLAAAARGARASPVGASAAPAAASAATADHGRLLAEHGPSTTALAVGTSQVIKDTLARGRVIGERHVSREELAMLGNLVQGEPLPAIREPSRPLPLTSSARAVPAAAALGASLAGSSSPILRSRLPASPAYPARRLLAASSPVLPVQPQAVLAGRSPRYY